MTLGEYLQQASSKPWKAGEHDCSAWPARWAGISIPAYSTDEEGEALIASAGGLCPLWAEYIGDRLELVTSPEAGDVGIIEAIGHDGPVQVGAIYTGRRWAFLSPKGLAVGSAIAIAIWRVPCPKP